MESRCRALHSRPAIPVIISTHVLGSGTSLVDPPPQTSMFLFLPFPVWAVALLAIAVPLAPGFFVPEIPQTFGSDGGANGVQLPPPMGS